MGGDFSAAFTGTARLSAANTSNRFNPAHEAALAVAFWVYPTQLTPGTYYPYATVEGGSQATDGWFIYREGSTNKFQAGYSNGTNTFSVAAVVPVVNTWYLVVGNWFNSGPSPTVELIVYNTAGSLTDSTNTGTGYVNATASGVTIESLS